MFLNIQNFIESLGTRPLAQSSRRTAAGVRQPLKATSLKPKHQTKLQASSLSVKQSIKHQASSQRSVKHQAIDVVPIVKRQAWRFANIVYKTEDRGASIKFYGARRALWA